MSENNYATKAELLRLASAGRTGVLELARELRVGPATLIKLLHEMREQGLVGVGEAKSNRAGRPKKRVEATLLGEDYLRAYDALALRMLKSRRTDLRKASTDAEYAKRLASRGVKVYDLFLELNRNARHAGRSPV